MALAVGLGLGVPRGDRVCVALIVDCCVPLGVGLGLGVVDVAAEPCWLAEAEKVREGVDDELGDPCCEVDAVFDCVPVAEELLLAEED